MNTNEHRRMEAYTYHEYGPSGVLKIESVPLPEPKAGQVLVKVAYSGVNPIDWKLRSGAYKDFMPVTFPGKSGQEFSGSIAAIGPEVEALGYKLGQAVFGPGSGSAGQYLVVKAADLAPIPDGLSKEEAASVPLGALTAWHVIEDLASRRGIDQASRILVLGGAGGVGKFALQFAKARGAWLGATASESQLAFVESLGAVAYDYGRKLPEQLGELDVVIDTIGGSALDQAYELVKPGGLLLSVAGVPSEERAKERGILAVASGNKGAAPMQQIARMLAEGRLKTSLGPVFRWEDLAAAQDLVQFGRSRAQEALQKAESGANRNGRVLLRVE